jgi:chromosome segregation ATPase
LAAAKEAAKKRSLADTKQKAEDAKKNKKLKSSRKVLDTEVTSLRAANKKQSKELKEMKKVIAELQAAQPAQPTALASMQRQLETMQAATAQAQPSAGSLLAERLKQEEALRHELVLSNLRHQLDSAGRERPLINFLDPRDFGTTVQLSLDYVLALDSTAIVQALTNASQAPLALPTVSRYC